MTAGDAPADTVPSEASRRLHFHCKSLLLGRGCGSVLSASSHSFSLVASPSASEEADPPTRSFDARDRFVRIPFLSVFPLTTVPTLYTRYSHPYFISLRAISQPQRTVGAFGWTLQLLSSLFHVEGEGFLVILSDRVWLNSWWCWGSEVKRENWRISKIILISFIKNQFVIIQIKVLLDFLVYVCLWFFKVIIKRFNFFYFSSQ